MKGVLTGLHLSPPQPVGAAGAPAAHPSPDPRGLAPGETPHAHQELPQNTAPLQVVLCLPTGPGMASSRSTDPALRPSWTKVPLLDCLLAGRAGSRDLAKVLARALSQSTLSLDAVSPGRGSPHIMDGPRGWG